MIDPRDLDLALQRRAMRRRLLVWRLIGLCALALAAFAGLYAYDPFLVRKGDHVAHIMLDGVMMGADNRIDDLLDAARTDPYAKAVVVTINSPGGSTFEGESTYLQMRKLAQDKPLVAVIGPMGASAAYMAAIGADQIFARENSLTGSIGVIFETAEISELMKKVGVSAEAITSGPMKDTPSLAKPLNEQGRQYLQSIVNQTHGWFVGLVAERRGLERDEVARLADGRIYLGMQAVEIGLIDAIGGIAEARSWLAETRSVPENLPLIDYKPKDYTEGLFGGVEGFIRGATRLLAAVTEAQGELTQSGLTSRWHPDLWHSDPRR